MSFQNLIQTRLHGLRTKTFWEDKRRKRIQEALGWRSGTRECPVKHIIATLPSGTKVYFLKPGKEVSGMKRPNPHDMLPVVGDADLKLDFSDVWSSLSRISVVDFDWFKSVLVLIYRSAFFVDHIEVRPGVLRYEPSEGIRSWIDLVDSEVGGVSSSGLFGLLHFLDLLGWNEDMKYHVEKGMPTFSGRYNVKVGRINTLLSCIRVPYQASLFVTHCIENASDRRNIDFSRLFTIMQQFAKSRGTCTPTQQQLIEWLSPYIVV